MKILLIIIGILIIVLILLYIRRLYLEEKENEHIKEKRNIRESTKNTQKALKKANRRVKL